MNHDALFKMLLKKPAILKGFFQAFVPEAAPFVDFDALEFVDKERFTIDGKKRTGDLLIKTRFRGRKAGFLIHLEHQAQSDADLARRMLEYFILDWREYDLPVYPIALLSHREPAAGIALPLAVNFPDKRVLEFDFAVVDLGRMDARDYVKTANPAALALAARMELNERERVGVTLDVVKGLAATELSGEERNLVFGFFSYYRPLSAREGLQLERKLGKVEPEAMRKTVMQLTNPLIELGERRGLRQGRQQGEAELVVRLLGRRLGDLSAQQQKAIRKLPVSKIEALGEALLDFSSPADLARWLRRNA